MVSALRSNIAPSGFNTKELDVGDVMYLSALGMPIIVLNTVKAANDLMGKRSTYNDRPSLVMAGKL